MSLHSQTHITLSFENTNSFSLSPPFSVSSASTSSITENGPYPEDVYPSYPQPEETLSSIYSNSSFGRGWSTGSLFANEDSGEENKRERKVAIKDLEKDTYKRLSMDSGDIMSDDDQKRLIKVQRGENDILENWLKGLTISRVDGKLIDYSIDADETPEVYITPIEETYKSKSMYSSNMSSNTSAPWSGSSLTSEESIDKQWGPKRQLLKNISSNKIRKKRLSNSTEGRSTRALKNSDKGDFRDIVDITEKHQKIQDLLNLKHLMQDYSKSALHLQLK